MPRRLAALLVVALLAPAAPAGANGNPASDVLLGQDAFLPYAPNTVSEPMEEALTTALARARAKGFAMKVAVVADRRDLGSVGQLLTEPQQYADLLTRELSLDSVHGEPIVAPRVLTVQPTGLGGNNLGDAAGEALEGLSPDPEAGVDGMARTAAVAIGRLAEAAGRPIAMPPLPAAAAGSGDGGGGIPAPVLFAAPVLLLLLVVAALGARRSDPDGPGPEPGDEPAAG